MSTSDRSEAKRGAGEGSSNYSSRAPSVSNATTVDEVAPSEVSEDTVAPPQTPGQSAFGDASTVAGTEGGENNPRPTLQVNNQDVDDQEVDYGLRTILSRDEPIDLSPRPSPRASRQNLRENPGPAGEGSVGRHDDGDNEKKEE